MNLSTSATAVEISNNRKTGPCSATYASQVTCPPTCIFLKSGCYGETGHTGFTTRRMNKGTSPAIDVATEEAAKIDGLTGLMDLRIHVVGDCATNEAAKIVSGSAERFQKRRRKTEAWTYTHAWRTVSRASWGRVSVLASCHTEAECLEAMALGYAASMTVSKMPAKAYKVDGVTFVPCLEQTKGRTCVECRLCLRDAFNLKNKIVILFEIHSSTKKANASQAEYVAKAKRVAAAMEAAA